MKTSKFDRHTTALEVLEGIDLNNKTVLITGANSGIGFYYLCLDHKFQIKVILKSFLYLGFETARSMALHNAHVIMGCRNLQSAEERRREILNEKVQ